jgi:hypothetical protein
MRSVVWLWVSTVACLLGSAAAGDAAEPDEQAAAEVIVSAPRGRTIGGIDPVLEVSPSELDSYGVDTLSDLTDALRPLTRSSRSDQMAVVLINGHLAGQTEFDLLPREAIERVEVLPEAVALQYGFSENQRVLNFVLREHFRGIPARLTESGATEGGSQEVTAESSVVRLDDEARLTVLASYKDSAWLRDSDRGVALPDGYFRTLQPAKTDAKIAGTLSRAIMGVSASVEASFEDTSIKSLQGAAASGAGPAAGGRMLPLTQSAPERTSRIATQFTGVLDNFIWGATAYYVHVESRSASDTGVDADGALLIDRTDAAFNAGNLQLSLSGPAASPPAGPIIVNFKFGLQYQGFATQNAYPGSALEGSNLVRTVRSGNFNASIPLANRERSVLPALGKLSASLNVAVDDVSAFGTLLSTSYSFDWNPLDKLHLNGIYTDHRTAPTVQQLLAPPVVTPNVELFDYLRSATAYVTEVTGGNDGLSEADDRVASVGLALGPFLGKTVFSAHFEQSRIRNAIGALPPVNADVELAFPDRFARGANGYLTAVDDRWINVARETIDDLKWGFNVWLPLGVSSAPNVMPNRVEVSLFDTWYLRDMTLIRAGVPPLDLLDGGPSDVTGGQPRHKLEFRALMFKSGIGGIFSAAWRSPTVVGSGASTSPDPIYFSSLGTVDLRLFADFGRLALTRGHEWTKGARMSLSVTNLFDRRQTVHDASGMTPSAFAPGYLDPPGRVLALTLRKVF